MITIRIDDPWVVATGLLGNVISFLVFLAPIPTFRNIYKMKSTESYDSVPYSVALFSATMWLAYGLVTSDVWLLSINSFGCFIEAIYLSIYLIYATKRAKVFTIRLLLLFNLGLLGSFLILTLALAKGKEKSTILGWVGSTFAFCVFVAPLSVIRLVIKTKSAKYMPFLLSFFLTLNAIAWLSYGLLKKDLYIALPNVLGLLFGLVQMALYVIYGEGPKEDPVLEKTDSIDVKVLTTQVELVKNNTYSHIEDADRGA